MARLSLLAEVLGSKELPGSLDLLSRLLETLNKVIQSPTSTQTDVAFIEQSLMSAIENAAGKVAVSFASPCPEMVLNDAKGSAKFDTKRYPARHTRGAYPK